MGAGAGGGACAGAGRALAFGLGGAKALPGETDFNDDEASKRRGRQLHLLLEHLPAAEPDDWPRLATELLRFGPDRAEEAEVVALLGLAARALEAAQGAGFLSADTLAEVEITAALPELGGARIHGVIDRLRVAPGLVRVLDYKSNAVVPADAAAVPLGLVRQMAAYRAALQQNHPGAAIECLLLWTASGTLTRLGEAQMDEALRTWVMS